MRRRAGLRELACITIGVCSAFTHALLGLAIVRIGTGAKVPARLWVAGALLAAAPDLDALSYSLGLGLSDHPWWSHRGLTHSVPFAAAAAAIVTVLLFPWWRREEQAIPQWRVWLILTVAMAFHGLTDLLTNGGAGIALFSPVDPYRYRWRFTPVEVSPLSIRLFFSEWGLRVILSELRWVIAPAAAVVAVVQGIRWWIAARTRGLSGPT